MEEMKQFDDDGNLIHYRDSNGYEVWREYNDSGQEIHSRDSSGYESRK